MTGAVLSAFAKQAEWCRALGSPFTALLMEALPRALDVRTRTGAAVLGWRGDPIADALPLRVAGGLHALVRGGRLPMLAALYPPAACPRIEPLAAALAEAVTEADEVLLRWLASAPQTNEVARSGVLMPGLLVVARETGLPLRLFELGASAGLNLRLDEYAYDLGGLEIGSAGAPVRLEPEWRGGPPPRAPLRVQERRGVDLSPIDVTDAGARAALMAYVWPDQPLRLARLEAALGAAAADPPHIDRGDAADWTESRVKPTPGTATVLFHSIAFQYFPASSRSRIAAHMDAAGARADASSPLAWLRYEQEDFAAGAAPTLRLRLWPGGEDRLLARAHPHGAWVRWYGADA